MKRAAWIFGGLGTAVVAVAVWMGPRVWESRVTLARHRPEPPSLTGWPAEAEERVRAADRAARSIGQARAGMAELARVYQANGFYEEALACYEGLREVEPREARWWHLPAAILADQGRAEEAEPLFARAAELAPDYLPAQVRRGDVLLKADRLDDAQRVYDGVLTRFGEQPYALLGLARVAIARDEWERAEALLKRAIAADGDLAGALFLLVSVHEHFGRKEEAVRLAERVNHREFAEMRDAWVDELIDDCYDPYLLSVASSAATFRRDPATAKKCLERAVALASRPAPYLRQLGQLELFTRNYAEAETHAAKAVELAPDDGENWLVWANVLLAENKRAEAYRVLSDGLARCPESGGLRFVLGYMLNEDGQVERAIEELRIAKRFRSTQVDVYLQLARAYFKIRQVDAGVAEMKEALNVQPDHPAALRVLADVATDRGEEAEARQWITRMRGQPKVERAAVEEAERAFRRRFGAEP